MSAAGYLAAVGSAALNGSWPAIIKSRRVKAPPDQAEATLLPDDDDKDERLVPDEANLPLGLVASAVVGVLGGSNMAPEEYASDDAQGIHYVPSFALSALLWSSLAALAAHRAGAPAALASGRAAVCPAMCAGAIYGSSICCYVAAVVALDYSVASTLSQCSMLVTGAWGILLYDELGGDARRLALYATGVGRRRRRGRRLLLRHDGRGRG
ncbi:TMEM144-like transporter [Aureococcus anophagefferens]|nr:TMEM144-like transporter [Aureococcus anophagefferens]